MNRPPRFTLLPLLQTQRDLFDQPSESGPFQGDLFKILGGDGPLKGELQTHSPLSGKSIQTTLDDLIKISAENMIDDILEKIRDDQGRGHPLLKTGLVVVNDMTGCRANRAMIQIDRWTKFEKVLWHGFAPLIWWTSDPLSLSEIDFRLRRQIYELMRLIDDRPPRTLEEILQLRVESAAFGGREMTESKNWEGLMDRMRPYLTSHDPSTLVACLFGDEAAAFLDAPPLGIKSSEAPGF